MGLFNNNDSLFYRLHPYTSKPGNYQLHQKLFKGNSQSADRQITHTHTDAHTE